MLALLSAFSFALMLVSFPVPGGTTAHAVGGTLIAIVVGPVPAGGARGRHGGMVGDGRGAGSRPGPGGGRRERPGPEAEARPRPLSWGVTGSANRDWCRCRAW
jgi:hypothetical protein